MPTKRGPQRRRGKPRTQRTLKDAAARLPQRSNRLPPAPDRATQIAYAKSQIATSKRLRTLNAKTPEVSVELRRERGLRTPRVIVPRGRPLRAPKTEFQTWFWAKGEIGDGYSYTGGRTLNSQRTNYRGKQRQRPNGLVDGPGAFHSNEGLFLGQVKFPGYVPVETLQALLNRSLNLVDKTGRRRDYRKVYRQWQWKYQVVKLDFPAGTRAGQRGKKTTQLKPKKSIVQKKRGSSR